MSLRVWLPLTKDLRQQGLDSTTVTQNSGTVISSGGKLGSCLTATSNATIVVNLPSLATMLANGKSYSLACWVKVTKKVTDGWVIKLGTNNCGLWWAASEARWVWNENDGGKRCANPTISSDTANWHHLVTTITKSSNGSTTTARHYVDGKPAASYEVQTWDGSSNTQPAGTTITISPYITSLNDIRLYDHCLSETEVKKLAQGLVLHYPLNRGGWGQENLLPNTQRMSEWVIDSRASRVTDADFNYLSLVGSQSDWKSNINSRQTLSLDILDGTAMVLSFEYKATANWTVGNIVCAGTSATVGSTTASRTKYTSLITTSTTVLSATSNWTKVTFPCRALTVSNLTSGSGEVNSWYFQIYLHIDNITVDVRKIKLEKGSIATPWCPNSSDALATTMGLNSTTEYDCSGFCNNGTRTGVFEWSSDTPKYSVSTKFGGSNYIKTLPGEFSWSNYDNLTIAAWMKPATTPSSWTGSIGIASDASSYTSKAVAISNYGGKFSIHIPNGSAWGTTQSTYTIPLNTWHHCVATISGTTVKMYVDGVLNKTFTADFGTATNPTNPQIEVGIDLPGSDEIYNGYYSDARIYATALSADDVKSLYQNCATIAADGTIYGQIYS